MSNRPIPRPGPGWRKNGATWDHDSGMRLHLFGLLLLPDGRKLNAFTWPRCEIAELFIRSAGGNRKRGLMMWAMWHHRIYSKANRIAALFVAPEAMDADH